MGVCHCHCGNQNECSYEEKLGLQNLIVNSENSFEDELNKQFKSAQILMKKQLELAMMKLGTKITVAEFNEKIPNEYKSHLELNPYDFKKSSKYTDSVNSFIGDPMMLQNNNFYIGSWNSSLQMDGEGKYIVPAERTFVIGQWLNGKLFYGRIYSPKGVYEGETDNLFFHGKGNFKDINGSVYEGDFANGLKEGNGMLTFPDGSRYWGEFSMDLFNGQGEFIWNDGNYYKGSFKKGAIHGSGQLKLSNGDKYKGDFSENLFDGKGKYTWNKKGVVYESYSGGYSEGKKSGVGCYLFENGDYFRGNFVEGRIVGKGEYETMEMIYRGCWKNGALEGEVEKERKDTSKEGKEIDISSIVIKVENYDKSKLKYLK